jgi:hypothetical protein
MSDQERVKIAAVLRMRNVMDKAIVEIIGRSMASGHRGEWIVTQVFDIALMDSRRSPRLTVASAVAR